MSNPTFVRSKSELKQALKRKDKEIIIVNEELAKNVKIVRGASKAALTVAVTGSAIALTNSWNPIGWGAAGITAVSSSTLVVAILALGLGVLIWVLVNDYDLTFETGGEYTDSDGNKYKAYAKASAKKHNKH